MADDDDYERTLLQLPQVLVFKIPTLKTAGGHRAADWPTTPVWTGKLKIIEKKSIANVVLFDDKNVTFAVCPVTDDAAIDRTVDSGRYFILRIENAQGKRAFIGIAFNERNDAFDFNVALSEHKAQKERSTQAVDLLQSTSGLKDLSLKDGEKLKINVASATGKRREKAASGSSTGSGGLLLPPPGSKGLLSPPSSSPAVTSFASSGFSDPFAPSTTGFTDPFAVPATTSSTTDPFGFDNFAPTKPKQASSSMPSGTVNLLDL